MAPLAPMLAGSSASAALGCSPPVKSASVPIGPGRSRLWSRSSSTSAGEDARRGGTSERSGEPVGSAGGRRLSFNSTSYSRTPSASAAARPPVPTAPCVQVGFAPAAPAPVNGLPSPGRLATKSSLLSAALLDEPAHGVELFGSAAPAAAFTGLVVLPERNARPSAADAMTGERLRQLQAEHAVFRENAVVAAYGLASRAHAGQTRRSGEPVLEHCIATAVILAELGLPAHVVAAGLLHDVLCDTDTQLWQLADTVPPHVAALVGRVAQLNRLSQAYRDNTHSLQAEAMLDMLTSMDDVSALLIKLADRLHNMRTISSLPRCKQVRVASETLDVFAVLANRLGAWSIKAELEDLSFKALNPEEYHAVADAIASRCAAAGGGLSAGIEELTAALAAAGLEVADVSGRVKNVYGVWRKVQKLIRGSGRRCAADAAAEVAAADPAGSVAAAAADSLPPSPSPGSPAAAAAAAGTGGSFADVHARRAALADAVSRVYDVQALRVVVPHKHDCYSAMRVVQGLWPSMPDRIKDYIRQRKANGYQSLHLTVYDAGGTPLEVQIRTPKMHYIAEYGFAAHWRYKERLGRQDLWLDRLVQWKKWVASEKLGIVDRKLRPAGSPGGGSGGDAALAGLAAALGLEARAGGSSSSAPGAAATSAPAAATTTAADIGVGTGDGADARCAPVMCSISAGDAVAAELDALYHASGTADPAGSGERSSPSAADERFAARFRMQPISEDERDAHGASVLVTGPRGVSIAQLPARCTLGRLLTDASLSAQLPLRRWSSAGSGSSGTRPAAGAFATGACRVAVNGVVVLPGQADGLVLRSGDQLQLLEYEDALPLLPLGGSSAVHGDVAGVPLTALPGLLAGAGATLSLFEPSGTGAIERALAEKLAITSRSSPRAPALV